MWHTGKPASQARAFVCPQLHIAQQGGGQQQWQDTRRNAAQLTRAAVRQNSMAACGNYASRHGTSLYAQAQSNKRQAGQLKQHAGPDALPYLPGVFAL
jgi:hypothetical protein